MAENKIQLPLFGLTLALGLIISSYLLGEVIRDVVLSRQIVKVRGYAEKIVESDTASWGLDIQVQVRTKEEVSEGYQLLENQTQQLLTFIKKVGIQTEHVNLLPVVLIEKRKRIGDYETNEVEFIRLRQNLEVHSQLVQKVAKLAGDITQLIKENIIIRSERPSYFYSKVNSLKSELLTAATQDAHTRAKTLAEGSGVQLGFLKAARQGSFSILAASDSGISSDSSRGYDDTSSIVKKITAVVTVDYTME